MNPADTVCLGISDLFAMFAMFATVSTSVSDQVCDQKSKTWTEMGRKLLQISLFGHST
jgi:hypothetical protein